MDAVDHRVTGLLKPQHSKGKKVTRSALDRRLKDRTTNKRVASPRPSVSVLAVDSNTELLLPPRCGDELDSGSLPADQSTTGQTHPKRVPYNLELDL